MTGVLQDKESWVSCGGEFKVGTFAVWRCPTQLPWDFELWTAVEPPAGSAVGHNTVTVSSRGYCNSLMAGGDFDAWRTQRVRPPPARRDKPRLSDGIPPGAEQRRH